MFPPDPHSDPRADSHLPPHSSDPEQSTDDSETDDFESVSHLNFDQWLETLQQSDRSFYNLMAMEVWSIAKTMDGLLPGFWSRFMSHRQVALKQFMQQKHGANTDTPKPPSDSDS